MDEFELELQELKNIRKERGGGIKPRPVLCFDAYTGRLIERYPALVRALKKTGRVTNTFASNLYGGVQKGEIWLYEDEFSEDKLSECMSMFRYYDNSQPVAKCDKDTHEVLDVYPSVATASRSLGDTSPYWLMLYLNGYYPRKAYKRFHWRYAYEDEPITIRRDGSVVEENREKLRKMNEERRKKESMFTERKEDKK